jgi:hypothetical protein
VYTKPHERALRSLAAFVLPREAGPFQAATLWSSPRASLQVPARAVKMLLLFTKEGVPNLTFLHHALAACVADNPVLPSPCKLLELVTGGEWRVRNPPPFTNPVCTCAPDVPEEECACFYESDEEDGETWLCSNMDPLCAGLGLLISLRLLVMHRRLVWVRLADLFTPHRSILYGSKWRPGTVLEWLLIGFLRNWAESPAVKAYKADALGGAEDDATAGFVRTLMRRTADARVVQKQKATALFENAPPCVVSTEGVLVAPFTDRMKWQLSEVMAALANPLDMLPAVDALLMRTQGRDGRDRVKVFKGKLVGAIKDNKLDSRPCMTRNKNGSDLPCVLWNGDGEHASRCMKRMGVTADPATVTIAGMWSAPRERPPNASSASVLNERTHSQNDRQVALH